MKHTFKFIFLVNIILLITITLLSFTSFAQNKIYIGFSFSPDYSFRTLNNADGSGGPNLSIKSRNSIEKSKLGYTTALKFGYRVSEIVSIETGIEYANKGYGMKEQDIILIDPEPNSAIKYKSHFNYNYIGIPLKAKFTFGNQKLHFIAGAGGVTNFLINAKIKSKLTYADRSRKSVNHSYKNDLNKIDITPELSIGLHYRLTNKIYFSADPTFRYSLVKLKNAPIQEKLWSAGLVFGMLYDLK